MAANLFDRPPVFPAMSMERLNAMVLDGIKRGIPEKDARCHVMQAAVDTMIDALARFRAHHPAGLNAPDFRN